MPELREAERRQRLTCSGQGDAGDHCCWIDGQVCEFLTLEAGVPRCSLYAEWGRLADNPEWRDAPVGRFFARRYPGFDCGDWPQRIPAVMGMPGANLCCWSK